MARGSGKLIRQFQRVRVGVSLGNWRAKRYANENCLARKGWIVSETPISGNSQSALLRGLGAPDRSVVTEYKRPQPAVRGGRPISIANVSSGWVERQVFGSQIGIYTAPNPP